MVRIASAVEVKVYSSRREVLIGNEMKPNASIPFILAGERALWLIRCQSGDILRGLNTTTSLHKIEVAI